MSTTTLTKQHPAELLRNAPLEVVLSVWGHAYRMGFLDDDAGLRVLCPHCHHVDINGPTAVVYNAADIRCSRAACRRGSTRTFFERLILDDADLLMAFYSALEVAS